MQVTAIEIKKISYVIYCSFDFSYSKKQLTNMYGPIVGNDAIYLYQWLIDEFDIQNNLKGISSSIDRVLKCLNINQEEFSTIREKLEAINLINTYLEEDYNKKIFHIQINKPLTWIEFNANEKLRHLLINKIGISEYERISLAFISNRMPENVLNISATFNTIFNDEKINSLKTFNFENLYNSLNLDLKEPVIINENAKLVIETYFKSHNLSLNEIRFCVNNSIIKMPDEKFFKVDINKLSDQFKLLVNSSPNIEKFEYMKINRNLNLFKKNISSWNKELIFADYKNINSEHYLSSIQKSSLSKNQKDMINNLRNFSHLQDEVINILTDFMFFKTKGKYIISYLQKLSDTINCLNLNSLEEILIHLQNAYMNSKNKFNFKTNENNFEKNKNIKEKELTIVENKLNIASDLNLDEAFNIENIYVQNK
ncbi:hypothetical protein [Mycoplasmoides pirum]|uniref:hypothetical protein n=1 Tax=Mycoplasmoides pirum TaxID=2122 RepID=UPI0004832E2F|nr:hypothetical protein [Mycoplasmoides pirum]